MLSDILRFRGSISRFKHLNASRAPAEPEVGLIDGKQAGARRENLRTSLHFRGGIHFRRNPPGFAQTALHLIARVPTTPLLLPLH